MIAMSRTSMTPTWLAIREAARRWLRSTEICLEGSHEHFRFLHEIGPRIADQNPRIVQTVEVTSKAENMIFQVRLDGILSSRFGGHEPELDMCWVVDDADARVRELAITLLDLASAGYPGCLGCGGADEGSWDESSSRFEQADETGNDS